MSDFNLQSYLDNLPNYSNFDLLQGNETVVFSPVITDFSSYEPDYNYSSNTVNSSGSGENYSYSSSSSSSGEGFASISVNAFAFTGGDSGNDSGTSVSVSSNGGFTQSTIDASSGDGFASVSGSIVAFSDDYAGHNVDINQSNDTVVNSLPVDFSLPDSFNFDSFSVLPVVTEDTTDLSFLLNLGNTDTSEPVIDTTVSDFSFEEVVFTASNGEELDVSLSFDG